MAKAPSARVSKTSGQGVSRLSYQKGYSLGNRGSGSPAGGAAPSVKGERSESKSGRSSKTRIDQAGGINISYGDTIFPTDMKDIQKFAKERPAGKTKGFMKLGKPVSYKAGKSNSGFMKGKK